MNAVFTITARCTIGEPVKKGIYQIRPFQITPDNTCLSVSTWKICDHKYNDRSDIFNAFLKGQNEIDTHMYKGGNNDKNLGSYRYSRVRDGISVTKRLNLFHKVMTNFIKILYFWIVCFHVNVIALNSMIGRRSLPEITYQWKTLFKKVHLVFQWNWS